MVSGYPKTPLFRIDGERGFLICGPAQACEKDNGIQSEDSQRSQERPGDYAERASPWSITSNTALPSPDRRLFSLSGAKTFITNLKT